MSKYLGIERTLEIFLKRFLRLDLENGGFTKVKIDKINNQSYLIKVISGVQSDTENDVVENIFSINKNILNKFKPWEQ